MTVFRNANFCDYFILFITKKELVQTGIKGVCMYIKKIFLIYKTSFSTTKSLLWSHSTQTHTNWKGYFVV
jgi:hypothetical protein